MNHGSNIISALEQAWRTIQSAHTEVPNVVIITGDSYQNGGLRYGHHWPARWHTEADRITPEVFIAGQTLARGGERILTTLLHEATHAVAFVREVKDTSRQGRYHNKRFAGIATELGLVAPDHPDTRYGYAGCVLSSETIGMYSGTLQDLSMTSLAYLVDDSRPQWTVEEKQRRSGRRVTTSCACGRKLQVSPGGLERGPIICGVCNTTFTTDDWNCS